MSIYTLSKRLRTGDTPLLRGERACLTVGLTHLVCWGWPCFSPAQPLPTHVNPTEIKVITGALNSVSNLLRALLAFSLASSHSSLHTEGQNIFLEYN